RAILRRALAREAADESRPCTESNSRGTRRQTQFKRLRRTHARQRSVLGSNRTFVQNSLPAPRLQQEAHAPNARRHHFPPPDRAGESVLINRDRRPFILYNTQTPTNQEAKTMLIRDVIRNREPYSTRATATVQEAAEFMAARNIGAVCVVDEGGKLLGVFSERDVLNRV